MNITQIIQKKFPKFTKEKYSDLFEEIIRAALNPVSDQKIESITSDILSVKSKKKKKQSFWFDILTSSFRSDNKYSTESKKIPQLTISYLKLKAKEIVPKLVSLSVKYNRSTEYVLRCYLDVCRYETNKKKVSYLIKKRKNPSVNDVPSKLAKNENGLEIEDEESKENKTLNLFIGSFDSWGIYHALAKFGSCSSLICNRKTQSKLLVTEDLCLEAFPVEGSGKTAQENNRKFQSL